MTLPSALDHLPHLFGAPRHRRPALFLDYDGTLTPLADRPEDAVLSEATRDIVRRLAARFPVIVVSGRGRADVSKLVGLPELVYAGSHGFDIYGPPGSVPAAARDDDGSLRFEPARDVEPVIVAATESLDRRLAGIPGAWAEPKRFTVAVHYREVPADRLAEVEAAVDAELAAHPGLRKAGGKKVWELRPDLDWDKGRAVLWLLRALGLPNGGGSHAEGDRAEVVPVYIGDDETDEDAFRALAERRGGLEDGAGGIGVLVSEEEPARGRTEAHYRLRDPDEVRALLERLAALPEWPGAGGDRHEEPMTGDP